MNSLNKRLDYLEESLEIKDDLLTKIQKLEKKKKSEQLESMSAKYKEYLQQKINERENFSYVDNIVEAIVLTINYIEENQTVIAKVLGAKVSEELKEEVLIHLIKEQTDFFESDMLRASFHYIRQNFKPLEEAHPETDNEKKSSKKWFK